MRFIKISTQSPPSQSHVHKNTATHAHMLPVAVFSSLRERDGNLCKISNATVHKNLNKIVEHFNIEEELTVSRSH